MHTKLIAPLIVLLFLHLSAAAFQALPADSLKYTDGQDLVVIGRFHKEKTYARFPEAYKPTLRKEIWDLGQDAAGISVRFSSNARIIKVKWSSLFYSKLRHMPSTGVRGLDLYAYAEGKWQYVRTAIPGDSASEAILLGNGDPVFREYLLNLSLYDGVKELSIGVNSDAEISAPRSPYLTAKKPVVYYGSSIAQGGVASRPGMAFTNILSRKLDRSFINLGFSGQGVFETSVGMAMLETDAALYVIDCNPNTKPELIYERAVELVKLLKSKKPETPVLLVENALYESAFFDRDKQTNAEQKRAELRKAFQTLRSSGIKGIYYTKGDGLTGYDHEGTTDGVHPNDLGMMRMADALLPVIKKLL